MARMNKRRRLASKWKGMLVPMAERYVREISKNLGGWLVRWSNDKIAVVELMEKREVLNMENRTCTCRRGQLIGLPCRHAAEVIGEMRNARWSDYVDPAYYISNYKLAYQNVIAAMPAKEEGQNIPLDYKVSPPHATRPRGRPKKQRVSKRRHHCSRCGGMVHHKHAPILSFDLHPLL
ncbi:uncharacterized protein LOC109849188 [Asparagus officinalis]|uniref:uncharacterized protein LOC109849188 n=1 Tax=Asparagus officinalis TaxID=4686 RepID=UPI00098DFB0E|nr:uncharacterized protein LOC109849188 [Asparagus officinalis]